MMFREKQLLLQASMHWLSAGAGVSCPVFVDPVKGAMVFWGKNTKASGL